VIGTAGGIVLAWAAIKGFLPLAGDAVPRIAQAGIDGRVLVFSVLVALSTSVVFSLAPAFGAIQADPAGALKEGAANIARGRHRFRSALVVAQITLGLVLLVGAELRIASFVHMARQDPGFRPDHLLTFDVGLPETQHGPAGQVAFCDRLIEHLEAIPGARAVATGTPLPLQGHEMTACSPHPVCLHRTLSETRPIGCSHP
jgi:putative ABC transport system permease protein